MWNVYTKRLIPPLASDLIHPSHPPLQGHTCDAMQCWLEYIYIEARRSWSRLMSEEQKTPCNCVPLAVIHHEQRESHTNTRKERRVFLSLTRSQHSSIHTFRRARSVCARGFVFSPCAFHWHCGVRCAPESAAHSMNNICASIHIRILWLNSDEAANEFSRENESSGTADVAAPFSRSLSTSSIFCGQNCARRIKKLAINWIL